MKESLSHLWTTLPSWPTFELGRTSCWCWAGIFTVVLLCSVMLGPSFILTLFALYVLPFFQRALNPSPSTCQTNAPTQSHILNPASSELAVFPTSLSAGPAGQGLVGGQDKERKQQNLEDSTGCGAANTVELCVVAHSALRGGGRKRVRIQGHH